MVVSEMKREILSFCTYAVLSRVTISALGVSGACKLFFVSVPNHVAWYNIVSK